MYKNKLSAADEKPVAASLSDDLLTAVTTIAGALGLAGAGLVVLCAVLPTRTMGASRSMQLVWENRQHEMEEAARAAALEETPDPDTQRAASNDHEK